MDRVKITARADAYLFCAWWRRVRIAVCRGDLRDDLGHYVTVGEAIGWTEFEERIADRKPPRRFKRPPRPLPG